MIHKTLYTSFIETPLGTMQVVADEQMLCCLQFVDDLSIAQDSPSFQKQASAIIMARKTKPIETIEQELELYFRGKLKIFTTPIAFKGTLFQETVWKELQKIPFGSTQSYAQLAQAIEKPKGYRAVGNANGCNQLAIIVPCHRVISASGKLGGYAAGLKRKEWLLNHEQRHL